MTSAPDLYATFVPLSEATRTTFQGMLDLSRPMHTTKPKALYISRLRVCKGEPRMQRTWGVAGVDVMLQLLHGSDQGIHAEGFQGSPLPQLPAHSSTPPCRGRTAALPPLKGACKEPINLPCPGSCLLLS